MFIMSVWTGYRGTFYDGQEEEWRVVAEL
jgi:hypothetical protein